MLIRPIGFGEVGAYGAGSGSGTGSGPSVGRDDRCFREGRRRRAGGRRGRTGIGQTAPVTGRRPSVAAGHASTWRSPGGGLGPLDDGGAAHQQPQDGERERHLQTLRAGHPFLFGGPPHDLSRGLPALPDARGIPTPRQGGARHHDAGASSASVCSMRSTRRGWPRQVLRERVGPAVTRSLGGRPVEAHRWSPGRRPAGRTISSVVRARRCARRRTGRPRPRSSRTCRGLERGGPTCARPTSRR